jgi:nickel-dependent lactate racemase
MAALSYNVDSHVSLPDSSLVDCGHPEGQPVLDIQLAVREALKSPIEYPPLTDATIPEDRVAIVLQAGLASSEQLVAGIVAELVESGVDVRNVCVLTTESDEIEAQALAEACGECGIQDTVELVVHRPEERESLAFLGSADNGDPVYLNRRIVDAEVVIPVGVTHARPTLSYLGVHGTVIPWFSDASTVQRFLAPRSSLSAVEQRHRQQEVRKIAWMLGTQLTVQVVPGDGDCALAVLAGAPEHVERLGSELSSRVWNFSVPQRADLVVAGISGGRRQQTWINFARTLNVAQRVVKDNGGIAVCCGLDESSSPSMHKIAGAQSLESAGKAVGKDRTRDALSATLLVQALERCRVYLLSNMDQDFVEELGVAAVSEPREIARLASRHPSCIAIHNAQRAIVTVEGE